MTGVRVGFSEWQAADLMALAKSLPTEKQAVLVDRLVAFLRLHGSWPPHGVTDEAFQLALQVALERLAHEPAAYLPDAPQSR